MLTLIYLIILYTVQFTNQLINTVTTLFHLIAFIIDYKQLMTSINSEMRLYCTFIKLNYHQNHHHHYHRHHIIMINFIKVAIIVTTSVHVNIQNLFLIIQFIQEENDSLYEFTDISFKMLDRQL